MKYTLKNGRTVNIPDSEIKEFETKYELSHDEAVQLWLEDNDYEINEELEELDAKAKKVKIDHQASATVKADKEKKPRTVKISDEKQMLFGDIYQNLVEIYGENVEIAKENKLILVKIAEKTFKIDLIEQRPPKK